MTDAALLEQIISPETEISFPSDLHTENFRRALSRTRVEMHIHKEKGRTVVAIRPLDVLKLGAEVNRRGLEYCSVTRKLLQYLGRGEYLKFVYEE